MLRRPYRLFLPTLLAFCSVAYAQTTARYLQCGALFDSANGSLRRHVLIEVSGNKIAGIEPGSQAPAGANVIDLSKETCLPGLIDTHTHVLLQGDATAAEYADQLLKQSLAYRGIVGAATAGKALNYGFTTIRDMETEGALYADVDIKHLIEQGVVPGPRMQVATRALDVTGAYPLLGYAYGIDVPTACSSATGPTSAARPCASKSPTARTGSRFTLIAATFYALTACSMTFPHSPWMS